jgi:hypothetical protein
MSNHDDDYLHSDDESHMRTCPACGQESPPDDWTEDDECPHCSVQYDAGNLGPP